MKRTTKRYVVTSDALNCYGYRVLTSGVDFSQFQKNPILLWMHQRAFANDKNQILPLGSAVDLKVEGDTITCFLEFDETDTFAMQVYNKYENGTLNMLSLGAQPLELSEEPGMMVKGQSGPTFTKSKMLNISCVDMGGNDEACACQLYDASDKKIELSGLSGDGLIQLFNFLHKTKNENTDNMKLIELKGPALTGVMLALKLDDAANEADVQKAVADMVQLTLSQKTKIDTLELAKTTAETELAKVQKAQGEAAIIALVDGNKNKYLPAQREHFIALATANITATKALLDGMPALQSVKEKLELSATATTELDVLIKLNWDALHQTGQLERLKELDNDAFLAKRAEKFPVKTSKK